jgi:hypothetical protein
MLPHRGSVSAHCPTRPGKEEDRKHSQAKFNLCSNTEILCRWELLQHPCSSSTTSFTEQVTQRQVRATLVLACITNRKSQVPWVYNSEVNSLGWRVRGASAATATNWMGSFIVTQFTKIGVDTLHWRFYLSKPPNPSPSTFRAVFNICHSFRHHLLLIFPNRLLSLPGDLTAYS